MNPLKPRVWFALACSRRRGRDDQISLQPTQARARKGSEPTPHGAAREPVVSKARGRTDRHADQKRLNLLVDDEVAVDGGKAEIKALDARRKELQVQLGSADEAPPLLHPEMAALYRQKVTTLAHALEAAETRTEALRGLIDAITLIPDEWVLRIELRGNLAAMLGATVPKQKVVRKPETFCGKYRWLRGHATNIICSSGDLQPESESHAFQACSIDHSDISPFRINHLQAV